MDDRPRLESAFVGENVKLFDILPQGIIAGVVFGSRTFFVYRVGLLI